MPVKHIQLHFLQHIQDVAFVHVGIISPPQPQVRHIPAAGAAVPVVLGEMGEQENPLVLRLHGVFAALTFHRQLPAVAVVAVEIQVVGGNQVLVQLQEQLFMAPDDLMVRFVVIVESQSLHHRHDFLILLHPDQDIRIAHVPQLRGRVQMLHPAALQQYMVDIRLPEGLPDPLHLPLLAVAFLDGLEIDPEQLLHEGLLLGNAAAHRPVIDQWKHMVHLQQIQLGFQVEALR